MNDKQINLLISELLLALIEEAKRGKLEAIPLSIIENLQVKYSSNLATDKGKTILYGRLGNRPYNCIDPNNPKHICYKECL